VEGAGRKGWYPPILSSNISPKYGAIRFWMRTRNMPWRFSGRKTAIEKRPDNW
jgi:hypothetical protein